MRSALASQAVDRLTQEELSYRDLVDLYNTLRTTPGETDDEDIAQLALAQIVGEFVDYLDLVDEEFEKAIGLTRAQERERILTTFAPPEGRNVVDEVAELVRQWRTVEQHSYSQLLTSVQERPSESPLRSHED